MFSPISLIGKELPKKINEMHKNKAYPKFLKDLSLQSVLQYLHRQNYYSLTSHITTLFTEKVDSFNEQARHMLSNL